ncbi:MAG: trans-2-enoyl-CoA reductase family protein [Treponema sp.]|nr:trans-2-enoyl-CoA reductase family protein [Treponema sp.]MCI7565975.1 trans-2-enoyl-CoA reductase family protein [Treponema sp.]
MIIKPKVRANICMNAHPQGCAKETENQIEYAKSQKIKRGIKSVSECGKGPKFVLVLGASTGYGLASRITAAFEYGADTIGLSFEKEPLENKTATPGWYNNLAFDRAAKAEGLISETFNADVYSHQTRKMVIEEAKKLGRKFDLVIYSIASSMRTDPDTGEVYQSCVKTQDCYYKGWGINILQDCLVDGESEIATEEDIRNSVKVMGGEDWNLWISQLLEADVLAPGCRTLAYSYVGPVESYPIYRDGTIGHAKKHLEETSHKLSKLLAEKLGGSAFISINKGVVTRSSAVIPVISLYLSVLFKIMKEKGIHEGCIEQMDRLFAERLYTGADNAAGKVPVDENGRIRLDEEELRDDVQKEAAILMAQANDDNFHDICDVKGYVHDFYAVNGFDIEGVDYSADIPVDKI